MRPVTGHQCISRTYHHPKKGKYSSGFVEEENRREQSVALSCCLGGAEKILSKQKQESRNSLCSRKHFPDTETFPDMRDGSQARVDECKNISFCCTGKDPEWNNIIYRFL